MPFAKAASRSELSGKAAPPTSSLLKRKQGSSTSVTGSDIVICAEHSGSAVVDPATLASTSLSGTAQTTGELCDRCGVDEGTGKRDVWLRSLAPSRLMESAPVGATQVDIASHSVAKQ